MQTFLPYSNFTESAKCLDRRRLGKQRVECKQIINVLTGRTTAWQNHPAVKMWKGHIPALAYYGVAICREWRFRGYTDSLLPFFNAYSCDISMVIFPTWLGNVDFHRSHQSNLLRKDYVWYSQFGWDVPTDLPYIWPVI